MVEWLILKFVLMCLAAFILGLCGFIGNPKAVRPDKTRH